jgi:hypothetical protein
VVSIDVLVGEIGANKGAMNLLRVQVNKFVQSPGGFQFLEMGYKAM